MGWTKELLTVSQLLLLLTKLVLANDVLWATYLGIVVEYATMILVMAYLGLERQKGLVTSPVLFMYWTLVCLTKSVAAFAKYLTKDFETLETPTVFFFAYIFLSIGQLVLNCSSEPVLETLETMRKPCPMSKASFLSRCTFSWMNSLLKLGYIRPLTDEDVFMLNPSEQSNAVIPVFEAIWDNEKKKLQKAMPKNETSWRTLCPSQLWKREHTEEEKQPLLSYCSGNLLNKNENATCDDKKSKPKTAAKHGANKTSVKPGVSLFKVLWKTFGMYNVVGMLCNFANTCLSFLQPVLLKLIFGFVEVPGAPNWKGYVLATAILSLKVFEVVFGRYLHGVYYQNLQMRVRSALVASIYKKSLTMNNAARVKSTVGQIVNLMSVDAEQVQHGFCKFWAFVSCPVSIVLSMLFLYKEVGTAMFAGLGVFLIIAPVNAALVRWNRRYNRLAMEEKDKRIKLMNEILNGIKVLKLYAWEIAFGKKILDIREKESEYIRGRRAIGMLIRFSWVLAPFANHRLDAQTAFIAISLFDTLRGSLNSIPWLIRDAIQAVVSAKRLNEFLNHTDIDASNVTNNPSDAAITINDGTFCWDDNLKSGLKGINISVPKGSLVAIVGTVGHGKSSLISAILGEMEKVQGQVNVDGAIAYVPQQAWIQNASLRSNILFGKKYNKSKYEDVVEACALKPDLETLDKGDKTLIGERGVNLSGGQKQRVSLARAVYFNSDIYLLDDPLSAVDSHVGKHIFQHVIGKKGLLKNKTRVLVTHGIKWLPYVDSIIAMNKGTIAEVGSYEQLMEHNGAFAMFMKTYLTEHNSDSDSDVEVKDMESKAGERPHFLTLSRDDSENSELEFMDTNDFDINNKYTGLRQRNVGGHTIVKSDVSIYKRSISTMEEMVNYDGDDDNDAKVDIEEEEEVETGSVGMSVVVSYLKAVGYKAVFLFMVLFTLEQLSVVASKFWLSRWTSDSDLHNLTSLPADSDERYQLNAYYIGMYGFLGVIQALMILSYRHTRLLYSLKAGAKIHKHLLINVLRCPMSFFDTTPVGRIVNRFSVDIHNIDFGLPDQLGDIFHAVFSITCTILVIVYTIPIFVVVIVPLAIIYVFLQRFFTPTYRQMRRIESKVRSPIFSHFSETLSGASEIL